MSDVGVSGWVWWLVVVGGGAGMNFDNGLILRIAEPVIGGVLLTLILRNIERRARLVAYYGHIGQFHIQPTGANQAFGIHTHSVVIKNAGKLAAHNVRVPHALSFAAVAVNVSVTAGITYTPSHLPNGADEIVFPILVAGQEVTIAYLYYPPLTWNLINLPITCDEGMARVLHVLPTPQLRPWQLWLLRLLVVIGAISVIYFAVLFAQWALGTWGGK